MSCGCNACKDCGKKKALVKIKMGNFAEGGLKRWFNEKWTKKAGDKMVECGSDKGKDDAKCRPSKKVSSKTPVTWKEMSPGQKKKARAEKTKANKAGKYKSDYRLKNKEN